MKKTLLLSVLLTVATVCFAQQPEKFPLGAYEELPDPKLPNGAHKGTPNGTREGTQTPNGAPNETPNGAYDGPEVWAEEGNLPHFQWGTPDVRYNKHQVPTPENTKRWQAKAWRGERVHTQALLWTNVDLEDVTVKASALTSRSAVGNALLVSTHFVRYVMTDELNKDGKGGCGVRTDKSQWDSSLVADVLDINEMLDVQARTTQPIWVSVRVPADAKPGVYKGSLTVSGPHFKAMTIPFEVEVLDRTLPNPQDWAFHLDLWQNPYAVARYYQVPLWSQAHFDAMRPIMKMLADAGQKCITTSIMHKPWAGQTEDHFDSMVSRMKKIDGTWEYDYTVFDKWVTFMMDEVGIQDMISCYTLIPWSLSFDYYDQATNRVLFLEAKPGDAAYADYWGTFLKHFAHHLREKGWFERTAISMDERPLQAMQAAIKVIKQADPEFKITLAGAYHEEIQSDLHYLAIPFRSQFPPQIQAERERKGQLSTLYSCCQEAFPNTFTFSEPAEATWTVLHALAAGADGYLRWAVNSWTADPLRDSRFRTWAAGDTYSIYPGPRSSIRFERLVEGLQDCEKIRILRETWTANGKTDKLNQLNELLQPFLILSKEDLTQPTGTYVRQLNAFLNGK